MTTRTLLTRRRALLGSAGLLAAPAILSSTILSSGARAADAPAAPVAMPASGKRGWAAQVPTLRVGLLGGENDNDRLGRYDGYRKLLEETFKIPVKLYPAADYAGVLQAFGARQIEMAELGSSGYAGCWLDTNGAVEPLVVPVEADGSISYYSTMVVRADSGITSLEQMKGHSLAFADPNSTSGYLIPNFELRQHGIDMTSGKYFSRTGFAGGHEQGVVAVLQKQYDACCTWISGQGDAAQGFTRGNLHEMVAKSMLKMSDVRMIWRSRPILNGPLTVRKDLPQAFRDDMTQFHLGLYSTYPAIYDQIERGGGKGYQKVQHKDFELFVEMRREEAKNRRKSG